MGRATVRTKPPGQAAGMVGSLLIHAAAAGLLFATVHPPPKPGPPAYRVNLTAAPALASKQRVAPSVLPPPPAEKPPPQPKPKPTPKPPVKKAVPIKPPKAKPQPKAVTPPPEPRPAEPVDRDPAPSPPSPVAAAPGETPSTGTDAATIKTPGKDFPYPEYLENIVNQVYRRWDRSAAKRSLSADVEFSILSDGTVQDIKFTKSSRSVAFDLNARGAIEAAGRDRAFGPLPKGWPSEVLRVSILFKPTR